MDRKQWKELCKIDKAKAYYWYNKVTRKRILKEFESLENCDKDAKVIHHLRDTEEQRKYNDNHYEMFGFEIDENGNEYFEYGKYVVFWTKEHHTEYHKCSEETKIKRANSLRGKKRSDESKIKSSRSITKAFANDNVRKKMSDSAKASWTDERREQARLNNMDKNNPMYGKSLSKDACDSKSSSMKAVWSDNEYKQRVSKSMKESWTNEKRLEYSKRFSGKNNPMCGEYSEDIKRKIKNTRILRKSLYNNYVASGGKLSYSEFRDYILPNLHIEE